MKDQKRIAGCPVSKASAIILKEWKNVKASDNNMKKCRDLYKEEKRRHEKALQRYQENNMDEMEIINLHKRCSKKARKAPQPKKAPKSPKSDEPKKRQSHQKFINGPSKAEQRPKKGSRSSDEKKTRYKGRKMS